MRRVRIPALMISLALLLCGCGKAQSMERRLEEKRVEILGAQGMSFTLKLSQDLGNEEFFCTLDCTASAEGISVTVTEPELIAGIKATVDRDTARVEYDGVALSVPLEGQSPAAMAREIVRALEEGHVKLCWQEKNGEEKLVVMSFYIDETSELSIWFSEAMEPLRAELKNDDRVIMSCDISGFKLE